MCDEQHFVRSAAIGCLKVPSEAGKTEISDKGPDAVGKTEIPVDKADGKWISLLAFGQLGAERHCGVSSYRGSRCQMKRQVFSIVAIALFVLAPPALAQELVSEKVADTSEYSATVLRAATTGSTINAAPTFNRPIATGTRTGPCTSTNVLLSGVGTAVGYTVFNIFSPGGQVADISTALTGTLSDSYLLLYCGGTFDPANSLNNLIFGDDDDGAGLASAITPGDNIVLDPGVVYQVVVTTFANGDTGTFTLNLGGDLELGVPVPTLGEWGWIALAVVLVMMAIVMIRRRQLA